MSTEVVGVEKASAIDAIDLSATVDSLRAQLDRLNLTSKGNKATLKKRLTAVKRNGAASNRKPVPSEEEFMRTFARKRKSVPLKYLLVIDFEATCWVDNSLVASPQEIIEFPVVLVDLDKSKILAQFSRHVRPTRQPILSDFCKTLTGITQQQVDSAEVFAVVLAEVEAWLTLHCASFDPPISGLAKAPKDAPSADMLSNDDRSEDTTKLRRPRYEIRNWAIATDCESDLEHFFLTQIATSKLDAPWWTLGPYVDTRTIFSAYSKIGRVSLARQLGHLGMKFEGREHCGLDDALNIAKIVIELKRRGHEIHVNRFFELERSGRIRSHGTLFLPD